MKIITLSDVVSFKRIGPECPNTCCGKRNIYIDEKNMNNIKHWTVLLVKN